MRDKIAAIIVKSYYSSEPPEQRALRAAGEIEALLTASLPLRTEEIVVWHTPDGMDRDIEEKTLTLEEHNQVVRGMAEALRFVNHWALQRAISSEAKKALTLNGTPVKVTE